MAISYRNRNEGQYYQDGKKKKPNWEYRFYISSYDGKRRRIEKCGFERKTDAIEAATKAYNEYVTGNHTQEDKKLSFLTVLWEWYEKAKDNYAETTKNNMVYRINKFIVPAFENYSLQAISTRTLQLYIDGFVEEGIPIQKIRSIKGTISNVFSYAKKMNYVSTNPIKELEMPHIKKKQKIKRAYTKKEMELIMSYVKDNTKYYIPFLLGYRCGLRSGEIFGLTWDDIDFQKQILRVEKQLHYITALKNYVYSDPKYDSKREIYLDSETLNILKNEKTEQDLSRLKMGSSYVRSYVSEDDIYNTSGDGKEIRPVCVKKNGRMLTYGTSRNVVKLIQKDLGIPDFCLHGLRHTHASELAEKGVALKEIQARLGHSDSTITEVIYIHGTEETKENSIKIIEAMYG